MRILRDGDAPQQRRGKLLRGVRLTGWGMYAPEHVLTNEELSRIVDTNDEWIVRRTGIRERRVAAEDESTASLAAVAGRRAIAVAGIDVDAIELIIVATATPDHQMPSTAALVKEAIGNRTAAAMDVNAACSGFPYAYATAHAWIASGQAQHVLVIGAEVLTRILDFADRSTCILFGDGAGAVVLSAAADGQEETAMLGCELTAAPEGAFMIWIPAGGSRAPASPGTVERGEHRVRMEGRETFRFATQTMATTALEAIEKAGLEPSEVDLFIPHQANVRIIEVVAEALGIPMEKIVVNLDRYGNTSAASIPMAIAEAAATGRLKPGDVVAAVAFGAGFTSGAVVLEWTEDPARGVLADAIEPSSIRIRRPVDWASVDPIQPALLALMEKPLPVPLHVLEIPDLAPGEPPVEHHAEHHDAPNGHDVRTPSGDLRNGGDLRAPNGGDE